MLAAKVFGGGVDSQDYLNLQDRYLPPEDDGWVEGPRPARDLPPGSVERDSSLGPVRHARRQPPGALSGIIVYCSAGHGFTADTSGLRWYTQRGLTNGVIEDMGNIDQLNLFIEYCFNAGATVVPFRPVGHQTNEVVLDNDDSEVSYEGTWYDSGATVFFGDSGDVPYQYAYISTNTESATAVYRPELPCEGRYPVYTWVRCGSDRVPQRYRIHHEGGDTEIVVDHERVGLGWVWLGNYYFSAGTNGYVEISNLTEEGYDPANDVVIADAMRFGNGMGDIDRGFGVSGYERELECSRYWVQCSLGQGMNSTIYDLGGYNDQSDNVGTPRRMAETMNRESAGGFWDRIYLGFHSNAGTGSGRGAMGLYDTRCPVGIQQRQQAWGQALADELNADMEWGDSGVVFNDDWTDNSIDLYGDTYGELYGAITNEMNNTIVEVAFHDNASDARLLCDAVARDVMAKACYHAMVKHLNANNPAVPLAFLPDPPQSVAVVNSGLNELTLTWEAAPTNAIGAGAAEGYVVYRSSDGEAFGEPRELTGATNDALVLTNLSAGTTWYFQVASVNEGGESRPSETVAACVSSSGTADHLIVNGFDRCDRHLSPLRYFGSPINGYVTMVRPDQINTYDYTREHGQAVRAAGYCYDNCSHYAVTQAVTRLTNYHAVFWILGEESTTDDTFSPDEQTEVDAFLSDDGCLFVSGAELAWDLDHMGSPADRLFLTNSLRVAYQADAAGTNCVSGASGSVFEGLGAFDFDVFGEQTYAAEYPDVLTPADGAQAALVYGRTDTPGDVAAVQYSNGYRCVVMGFPFETLMSESAQTALMARVLTYFADDSGGSLSSDTNIIISEIMPDPVVVTDTHGEWFELYNRGTSAVDIDGWTIADDGSDEHRIEPGTALWVPARGFVVLGRDAESVSNGRVMIDYEYAGFTLGNADDEIILFNNVSTEITRVEYDGGPQWPDPSGASMYLVDPTAAVNSGTFWRASTREWQGSDGDYGSPGQPNQAGIWDDGGDHDGDGMPDWWEHNHFDNTTNAAGTDDADSDDASNYDEWVAGSDPTNNTSLFTLDGFSQNNMQNMISWFSSSNRTYAIYWTTNLGHEFTALESNIPSTPPQNVYTDTVHDVPLIFYEVEVSLPED